MCEKIRVLLKVGQSRAKQKQSKSTLLPKGDEARVCAAQPAQPASQCRRSLQYKSPSALHVQNRRREVPLDWASPQGPAKLTDPGTWEGCMNSSLCDLGMHRHGVYGV